MPTKTPCVGDILVAVWGYDETITDFFEVTEVSATAKTVLVRSIRSQSTPDQCGGRHCTPLSGEFIDNPVRRRVQRFGSGAWGVNVDQCRQATLWQGYPAFARSDY